MRRKKKKKVTNIPKYNDHTNEQVYRLALLGLTDAEICVIVGISEHTLLYWKRNKKGFKEALERGKTPADARVADSLFQAAVGYSHKDVHILSNRIKKTYYDEDGKIDYIEESNKPLLIPIIKHYPPNVVAAIKILALRQRENWAETKNISIENNLNLTKQINFGSFSAPELEMLEKLGYQNLLLAQNNN